MAKAQKKADETVFTDMPITEILQAHYLTTARMELAGLTNRDPKNASGEYLHWILVWQTIADIGEKNLKHAWKVAELAGHVPDDDRMRGKGEGEHSICSTRSYVCLAKVTAPSKRFNIEAFLLTLVQQFKLQMAKLLPLVEASKIPGEKRQLSKRVVQA